MQRKTGHLAAERGCVSRFVDGSEALEETFSRGERLSRRGRDPLDVAGADGVQIEQEMRQFAGRDLGGVGLGAGGEVFLRVEADHVTGTGTGGAVRALGAGCAVYATDVQRRQAGP